MVCQEARRGVDCSRTSIASKDDSFEADNSPWQTTARAASPPRPSLYFTHVPGASRDKISIDTCIEVGDLSPSRMSYGDQGTQVNHSKFRSWSTASAIACHSATNYSTYHQSPIATTVLQLVYRWSEDQKKKEKLTCPPKAKSGHNGLPEGYGGTQAKHSSFYRRSMTSAITCCQAIWRFCLISDMNTSQFNIYIIYIIRRSITPDDYTSATRRSVNGPLSNIKKCK